MIYIHVPYCRSFCTYCGFYSETESAAHCGKDEFVRAAVLEMRSRRQDLSAVSERETLYIGGGTPSVLPLYALERLTGALAELRDGRGYEEFTMEVNPDDVLEKGSEYLCGLRKAGVDRVSMGVQSLDDGILKWMNRRHDADEARQAYRMLRDAGFENISIDLISGISLLSDTVWRATLDEVVSGMGAGRAPEHVSAYQLSVEPDSALSAMVEDGRYHEAADSRCEEQYGILCDRLHEAGYRHYEISNFALPGHEALHNSGYWRHIPYIGIGPAAHSLAVTRLPGQEPVFRRTWNTASLADYVRGAAADDFSVFRGGETLSVQQVDMESVMLGLRTDEGVEENFLRETCGDDAVDAALSAGTLHRMEAVSSLQGLQDGGQRLRIPENHFFVSDSIISGLVCP